MNEIEFREYLENKITKQGNKFSQSKINEFIDDLKEKIPNVIGKKINFLDINDTLKLVIFQSCLNDKNSILGFFNTKEDNGRPSNAVREYIDFLEEKYTSKMES